MGVLLVVSGQTIPLTVRSKTHGLPRPPRSVTCFARAATPISPTSVEDSPVRAWVSDRNGSYCALEDAITHEPSQTMSTTFQTAVKKNVSKTQRYDAIDALARADETTNLGILVRMGGLRGEFRRHALNGLADCNARAVLEELAEDTTIEPSLRRRAAELA